MPRVFSFPSVNVMGFRQTFSSQINLCLFNQVAETHVEALVEFLMYFGGFSPSSDDLEMHFLKLKPNAKTALQK